MSHPDLEFEAPYREALEGILRFSNFAEAEETIRRLDALRGQYQAANDRKGMEYCRSVARLGRKRAELIGRNCRVKMHNRAQKQEIAHWFEIWLETPAIFDQWLEMRKRTAEFQQLLQSEQVGNPHESAE